MSTNDLSDFLERLAVQLDIPEHLYEEATINYEDVGNWLGEINSDLREYSPTIYPQGSFRLGTVVRPLTEKDEFDIDLVCQLSIEKTRVTQKQLKAMVGDRLGERNDLAKILKELRRCWMLNYPTQLHMDVLPAIPNQAGSATGILITDREIREWQKSDPVMYSDWFSTRMKVILLEKRAAFAKAMDVSIEEVPDSQIKTPLQRAVQLLKRHRDVYFKGNKDNRPVSIILTTLAARAYENQADLVEALVHIVDGMGKFIVRREDRWWVANPVEPDENFADKWNEKPERREAFMNWLKQARQDFLESSETGDLLKSAGILSERMGGVPVATVASTLGFKVQGRDQVAAHPTPVAPPLAPASHVQNTPWLVSNNYNVTISTSIHATKGSRRMRILADLLIPKKLWLRFRVKTDAPEPYEVRWQVVNTGKEASEENGLRGGFYESDEGEDVRWERTSYAGTHWVEAFIIRDGKCIGRSGRKYVRILY